MPVSRKPSLKFRHPRLRTEIQSSLTAVESELLEAVKSEVPLLAETAQHLVTAGGKRFRPVLTLLAAQFGEDPHAQSVVKGAAAVELLHLATLHHDDVMDRALVRRGVPSVNALWGNCVAVRSGNFLMARATQLVATLGPEAVKAHEAVMSRLVIGQAQEVNGPASNEDPVRHHFSVIEGKTGSLISAAARLGALLSGADRRTIRILSEFGEQIGIVFQLADDILDIEGRSAASGKESGIDLKQGVPTLPVLLIKSAPLNLRDPLEVRLHRLLEGDLKADAKRMEALQLIRHHRAFGEARRETLKRAEDARNLLSGLRHGAARSALEDLCRTVADRVA
ncbi:polyprenyl synthetase family protein [Streptomyces violaceoruber]